MADGQRMMSAAADMLVLHRPDDGAEEDEIRKTCDTYGTMYQLMDSIFSLLHTERGGVDDELLRKLETLLEIARKAWKNMGMSETPKWHVLLCHAVSLLRESNGGLVYIGETHIEKFHQIRERDQHRMRRQRNKIIQKQSQAKFQNLRMDPEIKKQQAVVAEDSHRKLKRGSETQTLKEERASERKEERQTKRAAIESSVTDTPMATLVSPRVLCREDAKSTLEVRESDTTD
jgi:hypothetical protein